jgi:hypothetical protein
MPLCLMAQKYSEVKEVPGKSADQLYSSALEWFAITFKSANDVIQLTDPVQKRIVGKGYKEVHTFVKNLDVVLNMYFTLNVQFKDSRYKYELNSTDIRPAVGNNVYTYEHLQIMATEEGLQDFYRNNNINFVSDKKFKENLESNKRMLSAVEIELSAVIESLHNALISETENW